ncbi:arabinogalactan endo-1,4-beta-galactosidase [Clostridium butyricum]|nr:arabinogalactan endo-1,4-beta-galactosidase [Clostridium butyricum]OFS20485.1 arabinogalactan endo-1,4-beta-galactosidase [Clostridium sp. HMSC19A10]ALS19254.1 arabinogalactan endo-1,4-beta-galactosidase [Clostridium butyricum]ANF16398.1 arabinogalactan endo-1,4-beta-galactosidase [Clostridium butyricum]AOR96340.1 arabinogalactan endo-1,4-beta-galactosidase [Clostridium butyricum]
MKGELQMVNKKNDEETYFAKGADIGWLQQMEVTGYKFYNDNGEEEDCFQILKDHGINSIRLRAWVNPSDDPQSGHCSTDEVVEMAVRAKNMGFRLMIDLHYSDSWADPEKQKKPAAWENHSFEQLVLDVYNYTLEVMNALKAKDVKPEWVQIGNEIPSGMLWPDGSIDNFEQLSKLLNSGYEAVKVIYNEAKVIIHLDQGDDRERFIKFFDNHKANGGKYDVIGVSYYPYWIEKDYTETIDNLSNNLIEFVSRYNKEVMVCEVGGEDTSVSNTYDMLKEVIKIVKSISDNKGLGVFYWEPEGAYNWSKYKLSAWGDDGRPTAALDAFLDSNS